MKTSVAAINDSVYISMARFPFRAGNSTLADGKKRIIRICAGSPRSNRLQACRGPPTVGKQKAFALGHATENAFRIFSKLEHRHCLHQLNFKLKFKIAQG